MKTITFTAEFFNNDCASSVLKALQNNRTYHNNLFIGVEADHNYPFVLRVVSQLGYYEKMTFQVEGLEIDWACLIGQNFKIKYSVGGEYMEYFITEFNYCKNIELNLDYLNSLEGCEVKESEG